MIRRYVDRVLHPARYHGHGRKGPFFEGWYYKLVDATEQHRIAIIPGIFLGENAKRDHCFVQVLDGMAGSATYHEYPAEAFNAARDAFDVTVAANRFTGEGLQLAIEGEQRTVNGELRFRHPTPWHVSLASPGVMGPFAWVPEMECYHGVLSFNHEIDGALEIDGETVDFSGGRGYMEKDWGKGFPAGYVWLQTNHFDTYGTSLETAIAIIPSVFGTSFRGMQCGLWHGGELYKFTTYSGARLERFNITDHTVYITYRDRVHRLEIIAERAEGTLLHAPVRTEMHRRVNETLQATVDIHLTARVGHSVHTVYRGTGRNAGLEVHGDIDRLMGYTR
jgi:tocopherol cyclase